MFKKIEKLEISEDVCIKFKHLDLKYKDYNISHTHKCIYSSVKWWSHWELDKSSWTLSSERQHWSKNVATYLSHWYTWYGEWLFSKSALTSSSFGVWECMCRKQEKNYHISYYKPFCTCVC